MSLLADALAIVRKLLGMRGQPKAKPRVKVKPLPERPHAFLDGKPLPPKGPAS